jgi:hypothetical protein
VLAVHVDVGGVQARAKFGTDCDGRGARNHSDMDGPKDGRCWPRDAETRRAALRRTFMAQQWNLACKRLHERHCGEACVLASVGPHDAPAGVGSRAAPMVLTEGVYTWPVAVARTVATTARSTREFMVGLRDIAETEVRRSLLACVCMLPTLQLLIPVSIVSRNFQDVRIQKKIRVGGLELVDISSHFKAAKGVRLKRACLPRHKQKLVLGSTAQRTRCGGLEW